MPVSTGIYFISVEHRSVVPCMMVKYYAILVYIGMLKRWVRSERWVIKWHSEHKISITGHISHVCCFVQHVNCFEQYVNRFEQHVNCSE